MLFGDLEPPSVVYLSDIVWYYQIHVLRIKYRFGSDPNTL